MHPVLFTLPNGFSIHVYGFLIALGTVLAVLISTHWGKKEALDAELFTDLGFWAIVAGVVGARIEYVRVNWAAQFASNPMQVLNVRDGGLVFYGGLIGVLVACGVIFWRKKVNALKVLDIVAPLIPFGILFGRTGCFFAGCCYGDATDVAWAVSFPEGGVAPAGIPLHPTQLYAVAYSAVLFGGLAWLRPRKSFDGQVILAFLTIYPLLRSINEVFRGDLGRGYFLQDTLGKVLTNAQFISICVALVAAIGWFVLLKRQREA